MQSDRGTDGWTFVSMNKTGKLRFFIAVVRVLVQHPQHCDATRLVSYGCPYTYNKWRGSVDKF